MLQNKIYNNKNHEVGLVLFGAEEAEDGKTLYIQEISKPDLNFIRNVSELGNHEIPKIIGGDIFDVIDKSIDTMIKYVGNKKFDKKVYI